MIPSYSACAHSRAGPLWRQSVQQCHEPRQSCCPTQERHHRGASGKIYHPCQGTPRQISVFHANWRNCNGKQTSPVIVLINSLPTVCRDGFTRSDSQCGWHPAHLTRDCHDWGTVYYLQPVCHLFSSPCSLSLLILFFFLPAVCAWNKKWQNSSSNTKRKWPFLVYYSDTQNP